MSRDITITINPADYGYDGECFDAFDAQMILRLMDLAEEAARLLKGAPLSISLRDTMDRLGSVERRLQKMTVDS